MSSIRNIVRAARPCAHHTKVILLNVPPLGLLLITVRSIAAGDVNTDYPERQILL